MENLLKAVLQGTDQSELDALLKELLDAEVGLMSIFGETFSKEENRAGNPFRI